jgi:hypothetical protein
MREILRQLSGFLHYLWTAPPEQIWPFVENTLYLVLGWYLVKWMWRKANQSGKK